MSGVLKIAVVSGNGAGLRDSSVRYLAIQARALFIRIALIG